MAAEWGEVRLNWWACEWTSSSACNVTVTSPAAIPRRRMRLASLIPESNTCILNFLPGCACTNELIAVATCRAYVSSVANTMFISLGMNKNSHILVYPSTITFPSLIISFWKRWSPKNFLFCWPTSDLSVLLLVKNYIPQGCKISKSNRLEFNTHRHTILCLTISFKMR